MPPLTNIVNKSIEKYQNLEEEYEAVISIIPKGITPTDPGGYRYISVLNVGQKIMDKGLARPLEEQLLLSGWYPPSQHGGRAGFPP